MNQIAPGRRTAARRGPGDTPAGQWKTTRIFVPIIAPLLSNRRLARILAAVGAGQLLLVASGWIGWQCPLHSTIGIPCPGCGMTTALVLLSRGNWQAALQAHAFAPLVLLVWVLISLAGLLPGRNCDQLSRIVAVVERRTGITALVLIGMVAYWLVRLLGNNIL